MLMIKRGGLLAALAMVCLLVTAPGAHATTYSDRGAAVLIWPLVITDIQTDTLIQVDNTLTDDLVTAHCFYVNANSHCSNNGDVCFDDGDCRDTESSGSCDPGWNEIDFDIVLTQDQPLVWSVFFGLQGSYLPCPRSGLCAGANQSNAGTRVPPAPEFPFVGELKCVEVDPDLHEPIDRNDLAGSATIQSFQGIVETAIDPPNFAAVGADPAKYNAVGLRAIPGTATGGRNLIIGGGDAQYEPCPEVLIVNHLFDGAEDPISSNPGDRPPGPYFAITTLALVPCSEDFLSQRLTPVTAQFLVFNEFEQRFSTSKQVRCLLNSLLSEIDTSQPERSIFSAGVAGTVAGQTRIRGVNGGLVGAAALTYIDTVKIGEPPDAVVQVRFGTAGYNIHQQGDRLDADTIRVP